jgi:hypothetical protein
MRGCLLNVFLLAGGNAGVGKETVKVRHSIHLNPTLGLIAL